MKTVISSPKAPKAIGPYSQAILADNFLFISGQLPLDPVTGELVSQDIAKQTHQVFANLDAILAEAGCTFQDVVKANVYLSSMDHFATINEIYASYITGDCPARAAVQVAGLPKNVDVEIEAIALKNK